MNNMDINKFTKQKTIFDVDYFQLGKCYHIDSCDNRSYDAILVDITETCLTFSVYNTAGKCTFHKCIHIEDIFDDASNNRRRTTIKELIVNDNEGD